MGQDQTVSYSQCSIVQCIAAALSIVAELQHAQQWLAMRSYVHVVVALLVRRFTLAGDAHVVSDVLC